MAKKGSPSITTAKNQAVTTKSCNCFFLLQHFIFYEYLKMH